MIRLDAVQIGSATETPEFRLERHDYVAWIRHLQWRLHPVRAGICVFGIPLLMVAGLAWRAQQVGWDTMWSQLTRNIGALLAVEFVILWFPLSYALAPQVMGRRLAFTATGGGPRRVLVSETGVQVQAKDWDKRFGWNVCQSVIQSPEMLVFLTNGPPGFADRVLVPLRAFATPTEADTFVAEARRLWQAARTQPSV